MQHRPSGELEFVPPNSVVLEDVVTAVGLVPVDLNGDPELGEREIDASCSPPEPDRVLEHQAGQTGALRQVEQEGFEASSAHRSGTLASLELCPQDPGARAPVLAEPVEPGLHARHREDFPADQIIEAIPDYRLSNHRPEVDQESVWLRHGDPAAHGEVGFSQIYGAMDHDAAR